MGRITADEINYGGNSESNQVGFFSLKHDGDEALVRIMCDDLSELDIMAVHPITIGASSFPNRTVSCLRDAREPLEKCPLCAASSKINQKVYIKMLQYDNSGNCEAVVWERNAKDYVPQIRSYLENYGPLSNIMCKITRRGTGLDTRYDISPNLNPQMYSPENFPIKKELFEGFSVLGRMVYDKSYDEIIQFMNTGEFPQKTQQNSEQTNINPSDTNFTNTQQSSSVPNPTGIPERPTRYF